MQARFNDCGYVHEQQFAHGGLGIDVLNTIDNCKLRAMGMNLLCAHPNLGKVNDEDGITSMDHLIYLLEDDNDIQLLLDYKNIIETLDDISYFAHTGKYEGRLGGRFTEGILEGSYGFFETRKLGGEELEKIYNIVIRIRKKGKGVNEGEKARILLLVKKVQKNIEIGIRGICERNNIEIN